MSPATKNTFSCFQLVATNCEILHYSQCDSNYYHLEQDSHSLTPGPL